MAMSIYDHGIPGDTHQIYDVTFFDDSIRTLVTDIPYKVDSWITRIERIHRRRLHRLVVGLDVEWRPTFDANFRNPVATLQLCVGHRCLIFQILRAPWITQSLINFLRNPSYTFVGVGINNDVEKLRADYNLEVATTADLSTLAAEAYNATELYFAGLTSLTRRVLGKEINKPLGVTLSRWDQDLLCQPQVMYAHRCFSEFRDREDLDFRELLESDVVR